MSVSGIEGPDPSRASGVSPAPATSANLPTSPVQPVARTAATTPREARAGREQFYSPELTSGLLSDNVTGWQRESLGRLARMLRMQPRAVLAALRGGLHALPSLLASRRMNVADLNGMFDKGLLVDAMA
ncbi:hypothetical protein [Dermatophilus congolensis]|uniref:hypothetical protein n=1 Tax=Dermatophilus congolensis TaxID=1863 RepID=UPI001AAF8CFE|nr:hypothetical protein [Dermatophilus congolensis]MBO3130112.1 hypothetical protein [Dermatophilus congolensis]MBO3131261.1 hypothetical protein [Dermatophilus congolensis]MBO3134583.1 hypothetical protein [Dermatophilus congolensis]MBO3136820.1 hypothetical protein [Dermatophilus congolensis]MBO3139064.1 hypothetical protein [Dermatophilus congolensis]